MNDSSEPGTLSPTSTNKFVAVEGGSQSTSGEALLVSAYVLMWGVVFAVAWLSHRRLKGLTQRMSNVEAALAEADTEPSPPETGA